MPSKVCKIKCDILKGNTIKKGSVKEGGIHAEGSLFSAMALNLKRLVKAM